MATVREIRRDRVNWRPEVVDATDTTGIRVAQVIYYILGVVETILLFRFALLLFGANSANGFVSFIYNLTSPLVAPFQGVFSAPRQSGSVFETATILAMVVYAVIAYIIARLLFVATDTDESVVDDTL